MKLPTYYEIIETDNRAKQLECDVNLQLEKTNGAIDAADLLLKPENVKTAMVNQRVFILVFLAQIVKHESEHAEKKLLFENRNTDELIRLFQIMILLLRRIEFDLPTELQAEAADYILSERISATALFGIIEGSKIIIQKEKVRKGIIKLISDCNI